MNGEQIKEKVNKGAKLKVVCCANKKHTKSVIQYRLFTDEYTFNSLTKYQAIKYMSKGQKDNLEYMEYVKGELKKIKDNFALVPEHNKRYKNDMKYKTAVDVLKNLEYCEL